jgi:hypothetical protein
VVLPDPPGSKEPLIHVIEEVWSTVEDGVGVVVLHTVKYPNGDFTKTELVNFESGAPNPALFETPEGYIVRDVYQ